MKKKKSLTSTPVELFPTADAGQRKVPRKDSCHGLELKLDRWTPGKSSKDGHKRSARDNFSDISEPLKEEVPKQVAWRGDEEGLFLKHGGRGTGIPGKGEGSVDHVRW
jgi:hypothetical protein